MASLVLLASLSGAPSVRAADAEDATAMQLERLYDRIAADLRDGQPLRVKLFVALCDNDSQGIVPVKNPRICDGDAPERNLYWATSGGLRAVLDREGWQRVGYATAADDARVRVRASWRRRTPSGGGLRARGVRGPVTIELEALAYRGVEIRAAMADYLRAARATAAEEPAHVIGYIGHNHLLDEALRAPAAAPGAPVRGVFALSCLGDDSIRAQLDAPGLALLLLNRGLTYPGAWTVGGLLSALAAGRDAAGIHRRAADAFADGRDKPRGTMRRAFAYGRRR